MNALKSQRLLRVFDAEADDREIEAAVAASVAARAASMQMPVVEAVDVDDAATTVMPVIHDAPVIESVPVADVEPGRSWVSRIIAFAMLAGTLAVLAWGGVQVYYVITDSWVAPLHLSPQSDAVSSLKLQQARHLSELARLDAEVARIDGELVAIGGAIQRLDHLRGSTDATLTWQADTTRVEASGLSATQALLRKQRAQVRQVRDRQTQITARARQDLAAGLVDRTVVDREDQVLDRLAVELTEIDRQLADIRVRKSHASTTLHALDERSTEGTSRMPEIVAGDERDTRIEIEIQRLNAEARGRQAQRAAAVASVVNQRALLVEVESRPLYRAMKSITDVAFVPYDELTGIEPGHHVLDCTWGVFNCHAVGTVAEIMPGEVVTQDPWGEMARGQYVILSLDDKDAVRERVLRVRP